MHCRKAAIRILCASMHCVTVRFYKSSFKVASNQNCTLPGFLQGQIHTGVWSKDMHKMIDCNLSIFSFNVDNFWSTQDIKISPSGTVNWSLLNMLAKYFWIFETMCYQFFRKERTLYHQNTLLGAFRTNFRNIIGRNPSMVIPLLANQDFTPML